MISVPSSDPPPYGMEFGRCLGAEMECDYTSEEFEVLELDVEYNAYEGWYFLRTTAAAYSDITGELNDDIGLYAITILCDALPGCVTPELYPTYYLQGIWYAPEDTYPVIIDEFHEYWDMFMTISYCAEQCY